MHYRPLALGSWLLLAACSSTPSPAVSNVSATTAPTAIPSPSPTPTPTPVPTATPTPAATATPTPVPVVSSGPLPQANHTGPAFPAAPTGNALDLSHAIATASSGIATAQGAIDGNLYTEWSARTDASHKPALTLDLGTPQTFSKVDLLGDASPAANGTYSVAVSQDGLTWTSLTSANVFASNAGPQWGSATFTSQTARYVQLQPTNWGTSWVAFWEVRLRQ